MNQLTVCFYLLIALLTANKVGATGYHPEHLFVKMKNLSPLKDSVHVKSSHEIMPHLYLLKTDNLSLLEAEIAQWDTEYTERDYYQETPKFPLAQLEKSLLSNDTHLRRLWAFDDEWGMSVTSAYNELPPWAPQEIIVAVVDTGVDYRHNDLKNVMWVNTEEIPGDGIDNDGNGYVDDVHGINTLVRTSTGEATGDPMASHWHGTHVAGTIAAEVNNGIGIAGVAHNVKIMAIRAVPDERNERDSNLIEAYLYAAKHGAKIINCSFSKSRSDSLVMKEVIESLGRDYGILFVAAAGNDSRGPSRWHNIDSKNLYPASFDSSNILTVAASNQKGRLASFSNVGPNSVDVAAPGYKIFSTTNRNRYSSSSGTSMATPNASGVAAMLLGYYPHLSPEEIKDIIKKSAKMSPHLEGRMQSPGIINLRDALRAVKTN